jgi:hypothetical protein
MIESADPLRYGAEMGSQMTARSRRRGRGLRITGAVVAILALGVAVVCAKQFAAGLAGPLNEAMNSPARTAPMEVEPRLDAGRYMIFERTGRGAVAPGAGSGQDSPPGLTPEQVTVLGPDGQPVNTTRPRRTAQTIDRGAGVFTAAVTFVASEPGPYRVRVNPTEPTVVLIAPSLSLGFRRVWAWFVVGGLSALALVAGLTLLIVGEFLGRRRPPARPAEPRFLSR